MNIWEVLGIRQTNDISAIKKAYGKMAAMYHPEEHEQEFLRLRSAYEQALSYAENQNKSTDTQEKAFLHNFTDIIEDCPEKEPAYTWDFTEEEKADQNKYKNCEAILKFCDYYQTKKCSDKNIWIKYFVSPEFLEVSLQKGFCHELASLFSEDQAYKAVNKAFLSVLKLFYSAYDHTDGKGGASAEHRQVMEEIYILTGTNIQQNKLPAMERILYEGYVNYFQLLEFSQMDTWNENGLRSLAQILDRFVISYIYDKVTDQIIRDREFLPRHISSLKLLDNFFATANLPKEAYSLLFDRLDLANAKMGRNYVLYGNLRNIALSKYPELESKPKQSFAQLRKDYTQFCVSLKDQDMDFVMQAVHQFFKREDLKLALTDENFVHDDVLHYWLTDRTNGYFLEYFKKYCIDQKEVAFHENITSSCENILQQRRIRQALIQDEEAAVTGDIPIDVKVSAFFRYLLHTTFHNAYSNKFEIGFSALLNNCFPPFPFHSNPFAEKERMVSLNLGDRKLDICLHGLYVDYKLEDKPVYGPFISFDSIAAVEDSCLFWLMLPISFAHNRKEAAVNSQILKRLEELDFLSDCPCHIIADCLSQSICCEFDSEETYFPNILNIRREYNGLLHSCIIYLYEEIIVQIVRTECNGAATVLAQQKFPDISQALEYGNWQLDQLSQPFDPDSLEIRVLPKSISAKINYRPFIAYAHEEVTLEHTREILGLVPTQGFVRLEMKWSRYSLVILKNQGKFAFFCFDEITKYRYTFLSNPGMYQNVDSKDIEYSSFLYSKLPVYVLHDNPQAILNSLSRIIDDVSAPYPNFGHDSNSWQMEVYFLKPHQFKLDKCLLAGFPIYNKGEYLNEKFVLPVFPVSLIYRELDQELKHMVLTPVTRPLVSDLLYFFLNGRIEKLILSWADCHIALFSNFQKEEFVFFYLSDKVERKPLSTSELKTAESDMGYKNESVQILVYDESKYMSIDKKSKYSMIEMEGFKFPDFCVHKTVDKIHSYLNVLLPCIQCPDPILMIPFEFALLNSYGKKEKWNYEEFKEKLLKLPDTVS